MQKAKTSHADIDAALARLTGLGHTGKGTLFDATAFAHLSVVVPPWFET